MKRWRCPKCGSGCLAPRAPRKDDVRRYCLVCSKTTGRLVERSCPAAEARALKGSMKKAVKRIFKKHKERWKDEDRWTIAGVDIRKAARRYWGVLCRLCLHAPSTDMPAITVRRSKTNPLQESGRAWSHRITMTFGVHVDRAAVEVTLLHELAHSAVGAGHHHDVTYNRLFVQASKELFDLGAVIERGYAPTRFIERALRARYQKETES